MIDDPFRRFIANRVDWLVSMYRSLGLTPNHISFIGLAIAVAAAVLLARGETLAAVVVWWIGRAADGTDGIYARATDSATPLGAYLDIVLDMAAYGAMVLGFAALAPGLMWAWITMMFLYILCITTALALGMQEAEVGRDPRDDRGLRLGAGLAEGGETGIAYTLLALLPAYRTELAVLWIGVLAFTVIARTALAYRILR